MKEDSIYKGMIHLIRLLEVSSIDEKSFSIIRKEILNIANDYLRKVKDNG